MSISLDLFREVPLFGDLDDADLDSLIAVATRRKFSKDSVIFFEHDPGDSLFMILSGRVKVTILSDDRRRAREENRGRTGRGRRYSREQRREAVLYLNQMKDQGASLEGVARGLGVSGWSLSRWNREEAMRGIVRRVEVVESEKRTEITLVTPRGYRIEGLSEQRLLRLVEQLG